LTVWLTVSSGNTRELCDDCSELRIRSDLELLQDVGRLKKTCIVWCRFWWTICEQWTGKSGDVHENRGSAASRSGKGASKTCVWYLLWTPAAVVGCWSHDIQNEVGIAL